MPKVNVYNIQGEIIGEVELSENIFGIQANKDAVHTAIINQLANMRQGTHSTKTRSEVRGGGKKPWKQKGTGRARQGSIRAPHWPGGGITFGPKPRNYNYTIPKKVKRLALKSALSLKALENEIIVIDKIDFDQIKTKKMIDVLKNLKVENETSIIVLSDKNENVQKSSRNIKGVRTLLVNTLNVYDIVKYNKLIITKDAVSKVEEVYA